MLTLDGFTGINNQVPPERMGPRELVLATDVDLGLSGEVSRRAGYSLVAEGCHKSLHQGRGFLLANCDGDLTAIRPDGTRTVVAPSMGPARVRYCDLPDGRVAFSNGLIAGTTDGQRGLEWGIPVPATAGAPLALPGQLGPGRYLYALSYTREADGLEGPAAMAEPVDVAAGGLLFMGLPQRAGHRINLYLSGAGGAAVFLAGSTAGDSLACTAPSLAHQLPARTLGLDQPPVPSVLAFWRGRLLLAQGNVLWACFPNSPHLCDLRRDFKQLTGTITLVQPVLDGVYVGTEHELAFLSGTEFDKLVYTCAASGRVVPGSGVAAPGERLRLGDGVGQGPAMVCIVDGALVAGLAGGAVSRLTADRYRTDVQEVAATFRVHQGVPQYIAIPQ